MVLVHAADLHIDSPMSGLEAYETCPVEQLRDATRRAFENIVALCLRERAAALLLAGDVFDGDWRDMSTGLWFVGRLRVLQEAGVKVIVVSGNHDALTDITLRDPPANVVRFGKDAPATWVDEALGLAVHGQSYPRRDVTENLAARYPPPLPGLLNLGLLHCNVGGTPDHGNYAPCTLGDLHGRGYAYWALGHVHTHAVLSKEPAWVVYPGNPQGRSVRETGARGCMVIDVDPATHTIRAVRRAIVDVARWAHVEVPLGGAESLDRAVADAAAGMGEVAGEAGGRTVAARVTFTGRTRLHRALHAERERLATQVREAAGALDVPVWVEKVKVRTGAEVDAATLRAQTGLAGVTLRELDRLRADPAELRLLLAKDLEAARRFEVAVRPQESEPPGTEAPAPDADAWLLGLLGEVEDDLVDTLLPEAS